MTELDFFSLEGAALVYESGAVLQMNDMMQQVYPELHVGDAMPPELFHIVEAQSSDAVVSIGDSWLARVTLVPCREGEAMRLQLSPLRTETSVNGHLEFAVRNVIQQISAGKNLLLDKGLAEASPELEQYLSGINQQVCSLQKALDQCELSPNGGRCSLLRPAVDFTALLERVCLEIEGLQEALRIRFSREITGGGNGRPLFVRGDEPALEKCLLYLLHQGISLMKAADGERYVTLRLLQQQGQIRVMLSGSWREIDPMTQFEQSNQFIRIGGLQIARQLAADSGGALLSMVHGESTVFCLMLPAAKMDSGRIFSPAAVIDRSADYSASLVVLSDLLPQEVYSPLLID